MISESHRKSRGLSLRRVFGAWLAVAFALLFVVQRRIDTGLGTYVKIQDVLYIHSGKTLRQFSLGYEGLLADIYWTRAVQYFGRGQLETANKRYDLLAPLLRVATDLDPQLLIAYRFGAIFLMQNAPQGAGQPQAALELIRRGIVANPNYWRLWQDLGFVYYWQLKDYQTAAKIFVVGSQQPGADYWLKALAGTVAAKGGNLETSRFLWSEIYRTASTDAMRNNAQYHLDAIVAMQDIQRLNQLLAAYRAKQGRTARTTSELRVAGLLRGSPRDPSGVPYVIGPDGQAALGPASHIVLSLVQ